MKKILLPSSFPTLYFSMLLAIGLLSACSNDDDDNPFVGEWQLIEVRDIEDGEILYPSAEANSIWMHHLILQPNLEYIMYVSNRPEEAFSPRKYSYDDNYLTLEYKPWGDSRYKYEISENGNIVRLTDYHMAGDFPEPKKISTYKKMK